MKRCGAAECKSISCLPAGWAFRSADDRSRGRYDFISFTRRATKDTQGYICCRVYPQLDPAGRLFQAKRVTDQKQATTGIYMGTARNTAIFRERDDDSKGYATAKGIDALYSSGSDFLRY